MDNAIVIGILILIVAFALLGTANRIRRKSSCCASGDYKPKRKRLATVMAQKTFVVKGMHCEHCSRRVEEAVNDLVGVSCRVHLKRGEATVYYETVIDDSVIVNRIEQAGYTVCEEA